MKEDLGREKDLEGMEVSSDFLRLKEGEAAVIGKTEDFSLIAEKQKEV